MGGRDTFLTIVSKEGRMSISQQPAASPIHHAVLNYSSAAAIITNIAALPAYAPFRLDAAPM